MQTRTNHQFGAKLFRDAMQPIDRQIEIQTIETASTYTLEGKF